MMRAAAFIVLAVLALAPEAHAASELKPAPPGALADAPPQHTRFRTGEIARGFLALAFGSDLRIGARKAGIRKFTEPVRVLIRSAGAPDRTAQMRGILDEYAAAEPALRLRIIDAARSADEANVIVRLINERDFAPTLEEALGRETAAALLRRTDAQCMTNVASDLEGRIIRVETLIIVDQGEDVFRDCAYHELLHVFGLSGHDQSNPWTTLNQERMVGYLAVYDRILLNLLYSPQIRPGMSPDEVRRALPEAIAAGGFPLERVRERR